jgi:hypothetical protein
MQPPTTEQARQGLDWLYAQIPGEAVRLEPVYAAFGWSWEGRGTPPTAKEIDRAMMDMVRHLKTDIIAEPDLPMWSLRAGGIEIGLGTDPSVGAHPCAWIRFSHTTASPGLDSLAKAAIRG